MTIPSNIMINNEFASVVVSPDAGAALRSIKILKNGEVYELLSGGNNEHDPNKLPHGEGSFIMAPWINRILEGRLLAPDGVHQLPVNAFPHAIHGLVRDRKWKISRASESSIDLEIKLKKPWPYAGKIEYSIELRSMSLIQTVEIISAPSEKRKFPVSVGWHPWFNKYLGSEPVIAKANVQAQWELDSTVTATGNLKETEITKRLQHGTTFAVGEVDGCFMLDEGGSAVLTWPELTLKIEGSETITHFMFYSPGHALCVEPQTCTVDAARLANQGIENTGNFLISNGTPLIASTTWSWD